MVARRSVSGGFSTEAATLFSKTEEFQATTVHGNAASWEYEDRQPSVESLVAAAELGLTGIEVATASGGLGLGFREKVRVAEILSRSSFSFAFSLLNAQNVASQVSQLGSQAHRELLLPDLLSGKRFGSTALTEPHAGSDFGAINTTATKIGSDGWKLDGEKAWITNAAFSDVILCYVQTEPSAGIDGIACFIVDAKRPGFTRSSQYELVTGSAIGTAGFSLSDYEADASDMIMAPGDGFTSALNQVNGARIYVAAMCCAMVRSGLTTAIEYAGARSAFGAAVLDHQGLAWSLAQVANNLEAAEALTTLAVDTYDGLTPSREAVLAAAHAKKFAVEMAEPALNACMQAMGAEGLRAGHAVGRLVAEARIAGYVDGSTEMQTERIARSLTDQFGSGEASNRSVAARWSTSGSHSDSNPLNPDAEDDDVNGLDDSVIDLTNTPPMPPAQTLVAAASATPPLPSDEQLLQANGSPSTSTSSTPSVPPMPPGPSDDSSSPPMPPGPPLPPEDLKKEA